MQTQNLIKAVIQHRVKGFGLYKRAFHFVSTESDGLFLEAEAVLHARELGIAECNIVMISLSLAGQMKVAKAIVTVQERTN